jgi:hypothetical protein
MLLTMNADVFGLDGGIGVRQESCPRNPHVDELARRMRLNRPPVFGRVEKGEYLLGFRTLRRDEIPIIASALIAAFQK